jgi:hypothetical protein
MSQFDEGRDREEEDMALDFSKQKYLKFSIFGLEHK